MAATPKSHCPFREKTDALAHDRLHSAAERATVQSHLRNCEPCRTAFRRATSGWLPHARNYTFLERIGKGGFGVVYKAIHHQKERFEALKVHSGGTPLRAAYFEHEVHLIAQMHHPHIATLYECNLSGDPPYYSMEYVEGQQLGEYFKQRAVPLEERIEIVRTIVRAIGEAHRRGVIHRDIKPANILIKSDGTPRIIDFGIGKMLGIVDPYEAASTSGSPADGDGRLGTFGYSAPEQLAGEKVSAPSDIYSLGALLFHVITGESAKWVTETAHIRTLLRRRRVRDVPDLLWILQKCTHRNPAERYQSCEELDRDLGKYANGELVAAPQTCPLWYKVVRMAAFALRHHPLAVRAPMVTAAMFLLTVMWVNYDLRYFSPPRSNDDVRVITIDPSVYDAAGRGDIDVAGLSRSDPASTRALHTRLLQRLSGAGPRVIVIDQIFKDPRPELDGPLADAIRRLGAPVIIGANEFDDNWEPVRDVQAISHAAHTVASPLAVSPITFPEEFVVPLTISRGAGPPIPSLGMAAYAASRFPDCKPAYSVAGDAVEVRYQRLHPIAGEPRWRPEVDVFRRRAPRATESGSVSAKVGNGLLKVGDVVNPASIRDPGPDYWPPRTIQAQDVLRADDSQLKTWFGGRAIVIGKTVGAEDLHRLRRGSTIYGCNIVAASVQAFIASSLQIKLGRDELALRAALWSGLGFGVVISIRRKLRYVPIRLAFVIGISAVLMGIILAGVVAWRSLEWVWMEVGVAAAGLLVGGGIAFILETVRERQLYMAPADQWSTQDPTLSTTIVANRATVAMSNPAAST